MAKKRSKSVNTATKPIKEVNKESMVSKVEIKKPQDPEKVSKIVGTIFIALGILLVGFGIYSFVKYNSNPRLDETLVSPSMNTLATMTNATSITVNGNATGYDTVYVYVNGEKVGNAKVSADDSFSYDVTLGDEGSYTITVAGVKGFPTRYISAESLVETVVVDRTAPVLSSIKYPVEVGTETFTVTGTVEKDAQVIVKRGTDYYSVTCKDDGTFKIASIALDEGANIFNVVIKDNAGNETVLTGEINVTYSADSSVDGDATSDESIPVAAGEISNMKDFFLGNSLVVIFGIIALLSGVTTTSVLYLRSKRE